MNGTTRCIRSISPLTLTVCTLACLIVALFFTQTAHAESNNIIAFTAEQSSNGSTQYSLSLKILFAMALLTLLPALLMTATSFARIIIVLAILRQAIGMPNIPTNQILIGLSLMLTLFIMSPVVQQVNESAVQPYLSNTITEQEALHNAMSPFREFMLKQTREDDLNLFLNISGNETIRNMQDIPMPVLMISFVTSELKTAFQIGFILFIPFLVIDLVVASVLMSMGMMMLSPLIISLPFKIMLFVLVNGWVLVIGTLSSSFAL